MFFLVGVMFGEQHSSCSGAFRNRFAGLCRYACQPGLARFFSSPVQVVGFWLSFQTRNRHPREMTHHLQRGLQAMAFLQHGLAVRGCLQTAASCSGAPVERQWGRQGNQGHNSHYDLVDGSVFSQTFKRRRDVITESLIFEAILFELSVGG